MRQDHPPTSSRLSLTDSLLNRAGVTGMVALMAVYAVLVYRYTVLFRTARSEKRTDRGIAAHPPLLFLYLTVAHSSQTPAGRVSPACLNAAWYFSRKASTIGSCCLHRFTVNSCRGCNIHPSPRRFLSWWKFRCIMDPRHAKRLPEHV